MYQSVAIYPDVLRSLNSATLAGAYLPVGTPFNFPIRILHITNNSTLNVTVSFDGVTDHLFVPASGFVLYDFGCQKGSSSPAMEMAEGTQVYVKSAAGSGYIYVASLGATTPAMTTYA
jgi:hypothetical protein